MRSVGSGEQTPGPQEIPIWTYQRMIWPLAIRTKVLNCSKRISVLSTDCIVLTQQ
jgi:hypothetical protein